MERGMLRRERGMGLEIIVLLLELSWMCKMRGSVLKVEERKQRLPFLLSAI